MRLFERAPDGLKLTDAGSELLERVATPLRELQQATEAVRSRDGLRGRLRISSAVVFAHAHLARIGAGFSRLHPGVELEIVADDRTIDLIDDEFDIVIRANPNAAERLVGKCIVRTDRVAVASPELPAPEGDEPADLIFRTAERPATSWRLITPTGERQITLRPAMQLSTLLMIREAAIHVGGVALLPRTLIKSDLLAGRLVSWGVYAGAQTEIWALHASSRLARGSCPWKWCSFELAVTVISGEPGSIRPPCLAS